LIEKDPKNMFPPETSILIVDDNAGSRRLLKGILQSMGFRDLSEAADGLLALKELYAKAEGDKPIGLALVDWHMPSLSGLELLVTVRSDPKLGTTPFILVTTENDMGEVVKAVRAGVSDYVVKPISAATLQKKMAGVWKKANGGK